MTASPLDLPSKLVRTVSNEFGERGAKFLRDLPKLLERLAERWNLTLEEPYSGLSYHYVTRATRADGTSAVLKLGVPHGEMQTEIEALRHFDGHGISRLLEEDFEQGALLIERVEPGETLVALSEQDDDAATLIAAGLMRQLWRPAPSGCPFRDMQSWFKYLWQVDAQLHAGGETIPATVDKAVKLARELIDSTTDPVLLHGDLHHMNILSARRAPWLAIDPKGHIGDRCYELYAFMVNPARLSPQALSRRLDVLTSELSMDRVRARDWCFARQVLNGCWSFEDRTKYQRNLEYAELLATL